MRRRARDIDIGPVVQDAHGTVGRQVVAIDRTHQGGLSDPGFSGQHNAFTRRDFQAEAIENRYRRALGVMQDEGLGEAFDHDQGLIAHNGT